jgi:hypothetical protein
MDIYILAYRGYVVSRARITTIVNNFTVAINSKSQAASCCLDDRQTEHEYKRVGVSSCAASHSKQYASKREEAIEGQVSSTDTINAIPRQDTSEHGDDLLHNLESEALLGTEASKLHVVGGVARSKSDSREGLHALGRNADQGASQIGSTETLDICNTFGFGSDFFEGVLDEGESLEAILASVSQLLKTLQSGLLAVLHHEPPGRFGHEEHEGCSDGGESVLGAEDGSISPSIFVCSGVFNDQSRDKRS